MFVIAFLVATACYALGTLLLIRVLYSLVSHNDQNPIWVFTFQVTEPLLAPVRSRVPPRITAGLDLSPAIVGFGLLILIAVANRLS
jgi:YggT family protein